MEKNQRQTLRPAMHGLAVGLFLALGTATASTAQTMNVNIGSVTYAIPAAQTGLMPFDGTGLTIGNRTYSTSQISSIVIDETPVDDHTVCVAYDGNTAHVTIAGDVADCVEAVIRGAHVTLLQSANLANEITYRLSGTSNNGSLYMDGSLKASFVLDGLNLTNPDSAAINIRDGKRISMELAEGTTTTLTDGTGGSQKACFAVKGHTEFKGSGTLNITGNTGHAFWGKEYVLLKASTGTINILGAVGDGFNVNQYFRQEGGTVNISGVGDDGIQVSYKTDDDGTREDGDDNTGELSILGGTLNVATTAAASKGLKAEGALLTDENGTNVTINITNSGGVTTETAGTGSASTTDIAGSACMKSDTAINLLGGTISLTNSGQGGRAINSEGTLCFGGATVVAQAVGSNYGSSSGGGWGPGGGGPGGGWPGGPGGGGSSASNSKNAKGVKAKGKLTVSAGNVTISSANHEGMESKSEIEITGGIVNVTGKDDAINASVGSNTGNATGNLTISGGYVYAYSTGNDGIDANGNMYLTGGVLLAFGAGGAETGIDIDERHSLSITGGEIFGLGGRIDGSFGTCTQAYGTAQKVGTNKDGWLVLSDNATNERIFAVKTPASVSNYTALCSSASMAKNGSYSLGKATNVSGEEVNGFVASPTVGSVSGAVNFKAK